MGASVHVKYKLSSWKSLRWSFICLSCTGAPTIATLLNKEFFTWYIRVTWLAFIKISFILLMGRPILDLISLMVLKNGSLGSWYKSRFPVYKCHPNKNIVNRYGTLYNLYRNECSTRYEPLTHLVKATHLSIFISCTFMLWSKTYLTAAIAWPISWTIVHSRRVLR